jgi:hypothetical protein
VPSTTQSMLRRSPTEAFLVDILDELVAEFMKQEERCLRLEMSGMRVHDLILRLPFGESDWPTDWRGHHVTLGGAGGTTGG